MSSAPLGKKSVNNYTIEEAVDVIKDKKRIKADGFEKAYERFLKALPFKVDDKQYYGHSGFFRITRLECDCEAYVAKKIRWKEMPWRLRVVFRVKENVIQIIEVYVKGQKDVEDRERICEYCK